MLNVPRVIVVSAVMLIGLLLGLTTTASANDPGDLDTGFGMTGIVTTPIGNGDDVGQAVAIQVDGKLVVAGSASYGGVRHFALARYDRAGGLDSTFGSGGVVTTTIDLECFGRAVVIQADGSIVVGGASINNGTNGDFALVRYHTDGSLDTSFGTNGVITTSIGGGDDQGYAVAIQNDGKILAAGSSHDGNDYNFAVVRYNANGSLDSSFGHSGVVTTPIGSSNDWGYGIAIQPDEKIVVAGSSNSGAGGNIAVVRYDSSGSLDSNFGNSGIVTTSIGLGASGSAVAIQNNGKIVVAGISRESTSDFTTVRYDNNSAPDTTFGVNGVVTTTIGQGGGATAVAIQPGNKIVVAGVSYNGSNYDFGVIRYLSDGAVDNTFGNEGKVITPIGSGDDNSYGVAIQADGKIVVVGYSHNGSNTDFAVVRYFGDRYLYLPIILKRT